MAISVVNEEERPLFQRLKTRAAVGSATVMLPSALAAPRTETQPAASPAAVLPVIVEPAADLDRWAREAGERAATAVRGALAAELARMRQDAERALALEMAALRRQELARLDEWRAAQRRRIGEQLEAEHRALFARMREDASTVLREAVGRVIEQVFRPERSDPA